MSKTLICITTCNRLNQLKSYILPYILFCNKNDEFSLLVSADGPSEEYRSFCDELDIPLIYSEQREGVGLSKNRVLTQFPDFNHYFFLDDDVELYDSNVFQLIIDTADTHKFHHMCITPFNSPKRLNVDTDLTIQYGNKGGGYFNYFSAHGLKTVGGWHTKFAEFKRFGHTEHSIRFRTNNLQPAPFISIEESINMVILHDPPHVTKINIEMNDQEISLPEESIIEDNLKHFPVQTISSFEYNGKSINFNKKIETLRKDLSTSYPLLNGKQRRNALSNFYFFQFKINRGFFKKLYYISLSLFNWPNNPKIKHAVKTRF